MSPHPHSHAHDRQHNHGNPEDLASYVARMEDPARDAWQKPDEVIAALGVSPGQCVCDIGAGPGYFSLRLGRAVGAQGRVFAVDVEPAILGVLRERVQSSGLRNVTPVLALADDALLPDGACDVIVIVNTYHHFPDGVAYLRRLQRALKPGGRITNIDFHKRDLPVGPPLEHKVTRDEFVAQARAAGLAVVGEPGFLPYQYFVILQPQPK